jgi:hypothetical protein
MEAGMSLFECFFGSKVQLVSIQSDSFITEKFFKVDIFNDT